MVSQNNGTAVHARYLRDVPLSRDDPGIRSKQLHGGAAPAWICWFDPGAKVPAHTHAYSSTVLVLEGRGSMVIDGRSIQLEPGAVVSFGAHVAHSLECSERMTTLEIGGPP